MKKLGLMAIFIAGALSLTVSANFRVDTVDALFETDTIESFRDIADDPSVLINFQQPQQSLILGTNKRSGGGIEFYTLDGKRLGKYKYGKVNNVDVIQDPQGSSLRNFIVATEKDKNELIVLTFDFARGEAIPLDTMKLRHARYSYGICAAYDQRVNQAFAFVTTKDGILERWHIHQDGMLSFDGAITIGSQIEGCVVDSDNGILYVGEEDYGIWVLDSLDFTKRPEMFYSVDRKYLHDDVEGLTIKRSGNKKYLVASSQGDHSFLAFDLATRDIVKKFNVRFEGNDYVTETDGIHASELVIPGVFDQGFLIVQDHHDDGARAFGQNFKIIPWENIGL